MQSNQLDDLFELLRDNLFYATRSGLPHLR
jgi:hypothetical protein